jgi:hypothetical protein
MHSFGVAPGLEEGRGDRFSFMFGVGPNKSSVREIHTVKHTNSFPILTSDTVVLK